MQISFKRLTDYPNRVRMLRLDDETEWNRELLHPHFTMQELDDNSDFLDDNSEFTGFFLPRHLIN